MDTINVPKQKNNNNNERTTQDLGDFVQLPMYRFIGHFLGHVQVTVLSDTLRLSLNYVFIEVN